MFIGYVDMHQKNLNFTYLWHRQDPLIDDDVLIDNVRYIVRGTLRDPYTEYTTGAFPADHLQSLETYPSQVLELRVWCQTAEADCIRPGPVKYLQGSISFDLGPCTLQRNPLGFRWNGDYSYRITVVAAHSAVTDVVIQLFESEDGSISCLNLAGEAVLSVPPNTDAQMLRHELAKKISPHANLHLINERGKLLPQEDVWGVMRGERSFIPPPADVDGDD